MAFLLPATLQKRLVRYVLSQLSFLDMASFDLDRLEGAWGRRATGEIRDIPFKIEKLTELLRLPAWVKVNRAEVHSLKLIVPLNIWSEGIEIIIDGVDIHCTIDDGRPKDKGIPKGVKTNQPRDPHHINHDPGGVGHHVIPSVEEMAQSFVAHQSDGEKDRLQAEILQQSTLAESQSSVDSDVEEGLGPQFSLPAVMADFLWGIGERLKVTVRNIKFEVDFNLDVSQSVQPPVSSSPVAFALTVNLVELRGVQASTVKAPAKEPSLPLGNHTAIISNIQGSVISEPELYAAFSTLSIPASPTATYASSAPADNASVSSPSMTRSDPSDSDRTDFNSTSMSSSQELTMSSSTILDPFQSMSQSIYHSQAGPDSIELDGQNDRPASAESSRYYGFESQATVSRFGDYSSPDQSFLESGDLESPRRSVSALQESKDRLQETSQVSPVAGSREQLAMALENPAASNSALSNPTGHMQIFHAQDESSDHPETRPHEDLRPLSSQSSVFHDFEGNDEQTSAHDISQAQAGRHFPTESISPAAADIKPTMSSSSASSSSLSQHLPAAETTSPESRSERAGETSSDLTESILFDPDIARSLYMSAVAESQVLSSVHETQDLEMNIPGAWGLQSTVTTTEDIHDRFGEGVSGRADNEIHSTNSVFVEDPPASSQTHKAGDTQPDSVALEDDHNDDRDSIRDNSEKNARRKSTLLRRRLLLIKSVTIHIPFTLVRGPSLSADEQHSPERPNSPSAHRMPGEMSMYDETLSKLGKSTMRASITASRQDSFGSDIKEEDSGISLVVDQIVIENDMSMVKLLTAIAQQVVSISKDVTDGQAQPVRQTRHPNWNLTLKEFSWTLVDSMRTSVDFGVSEADIRYPTTNVLLMTQVNNFHASYIMRDCTALYTITVGRYEFGYVDDPIIHFDQLIQPPQPSSQREQREHREHRERDVSIKVQVYSNGLRDVKISTLPLRTIIDLRRLDDTFQWFGGLSGMIGLSNSVMSTTTVTEQKKSTKPARVHFETPDGHGFVHEKVNVEESTLKITAVVNGMAIDIFGQDSALHFKTSPLKLVHRPEGVRLQIDKIDFSGPQLHNNSLEKSIHAFVGPLKLTYLPTPREQDLTRLLGLLSPSVHSRDEDEDDVLVDTLLRQRRKGGVLCVNVDHVQCNIGHLRHLNHLSVLIDEMKKLATVAKYLPEDDRPGVMVLFLAQDAKVDLKVNSNIGNVSLSLKNLELACVTMPLLLLVGLDCLKVFRGHEELISDLVPQRPRQIRNNTLEGNNLTPVLRGKFIGNDLEPTVKIRLFNVRVEYHVHTVMALLGITETPSGEIIIAEMVDSVASLADTMVSPTSRSQAAESSTKLPTNSKPLKIDVRFRDCAIGLNPRRIPAKGLILLADVNFQTSLPSNVNTAIKAVLKFQKLSLLVVDDKQLLRAPSRNTASLDAVSSAPDTIAACLARAGYMKTTDIADAGAAFSLSSKDPQGERTLDIDVTDKLLVLDSCADSTQTMLSVFSGLSPPMPPNDQLKYRTEVMPMEDMLSSIVGEISLVEDNSSENPSRRWSVSGDLETPRKPKSDPESLDLAREMGYAFAESDDEGMADSTKPYGALKLNNENFFTATSSTAWKGTAMEFGSKDKAHRLASKARVEKSPLRVRVQEINLIWNLYDGYDWQHTRNVIGEAVADVERRVAARRAYRRSPADVQGPDDDSVVGDFLFNSVYIGVGAKDDPRDLARQINRHIADDELETASYATPTTVLSTGANPRNTQAKTKRKHLRLERSKRQKITIDLKDVSADFIVYQPGSEETQSSLILRVGDLEIYDHLRTSTWKKFATYMHDYGPRDVSTPMAVIEILNIKLVPDLPASELAMRVKILPLRLHVDQDALDFMTRFFEFKNTKTENVSPSSAPGEQPFIHRFEIHAIPVKLDFKPKRVDYGGLKSGKTTEFMNFIILDGADMVLEHIVMFGIPGFERLGKMLNDIWMPAIKQNQLAGVLAGLAPIRGIVDVGSGVKDLVMVPWLEYRRDGRLMRAMQKGAFAFAKNTTTQLTKFGAKVALGTQNFLLNAEDMLVGPSDESDGFGNPRNAPGTDEDRPQLISPYADQPLGVMAGLKGAYRHLERDMLHTRDAIIAMPGEVRDSGSATGAARVVLAGAPTVILRPAIGVTRAIGTALIGATNALDKDEIRRAEDKYKRNSS